MSKALSVTSSRPSSRCFLRLSLLRPLLASSRLPLLFAALWRRRRLPLQPWCVFKSAPSSLPSSTFFRKNVASFLAPQYVLSAFLLKFLIKRRQENRIKVSFPRVFLLGRKKESSFRGCSFRRRRRAVSIGAIWTTKWIGIFPSVIPTKVTKSSRLNQSRRPFPPKPTRRRREHHQHGVAFRSLSLSLSLCRRRKKTTTTTAFVGVGNTEGVTLEIYSRRLVPFGTF